MIACDNSDKNVDDYKKIIELLVTKKASIDKEDLDGETPLMLACRKQIIDIIKCLVEHGANINKKNKNGETALTITKKKNSSKKTKKKAKKKAKKENIETSELIVKYLEEHITKEVIPCEKINNTKTKDSGLLI